MDGTGENKENTEDGHAHEYVPTRRFLDNTRLNVDRGINIINCWSGHQMAAWTYEGRKPIDKKYLTWKGEPKEKILYDPSDATKLADDDTLFVSYAKIEEFTMDFLPYINTTFVLITTPFHILYPAGIDLLAPNITSNKHLLQWFATNIGNYTGGHQFHPLVSPFPLGLKPHMGSRPFQHPIPYYREIFLKTMNDTEEMTMKKISCLLDIYLALTRIARSRYVISPNGDHPDCHRHYEALGLGAIPITQLDPYLYSHLKEGPIIYGNDNWNLTELTSTLTLPAPKVNRNIIFEEYWMEYVERVVGRPLWWWDVVDAKRSKLAEFAASNQYKLQSNDTL
eukprot:15366643-Ditylum_brightwellii.AAC.1